MIKTYLEKIWIENSTDSKIKWINVAKLFAIFAVMLEHSYTHLYNNQDVASFTYYSVSLFILLMGITMYWSCKRNSEKTYKMILKKIRLILYPYLFATFLYTIVLYKSFEFETYITHVVHFDISGPYYYVLLYIQLLIISPIVFATIQIGRNSRITWLYEIIKIVILVLISWITTNYTNILSVYGGGGKLFGGTYLLLLYIGMLWGRMYHKIKISKWVSFGGSLILLVATIGWWRFMCINKLQLDSLIPFGVGFNPPSISFILYAILFALTIYFISAFIDNTKIKILCFFQIILSKLGEHTLYIFLFHHFFIAEFFPVIEKYYIFENVWIKRIIYFSVMIFGSLFIEFCVNAIIKIYHKNYYKGQV